MARRIASLATLGACLAIAVGGCGDSGSGGKQAGPLPPIASPVDHPAKVTRHAVPRHGNWNVSVVLMNTADDPRTIHVDLNGVPAVDARFTQSPNDRPWPYYFHVASRRLSLHATSTGGGMASKVARVEAGHRVWFVVTDYQPLRLGLQVHTYSREPVFG
ncbi:MAG: hypothetical protein JO246_12065 [Frankiaceae bacterium]|nr:hypothetical protein [Frankiaceae bacterium]MBV9872411.1 hypothetical protein [Frankiaceae bacterium]